jgi:hypothetical protein
VSAIYGYHKEFDIPVEFPIVQQSLTRYVETQETVFAFHMPHDDDPDATELQTIGIRRQLLAERQKKAIAAQYASLPQVTTAEITWLEDVPLSFEQQELVGKLLNVAFIRYRKHVRQQAAAIIPHEVLEFQIASAGILEFQHLLNLYANAAYFAVMFGPRVANTTLRYIRKIYVIGDAARAAVLN